MEPAILEALIKGFLTNMGLTIAIGAQNAFVLKQGILRSHIFIIALLCSVIDSILIIIGVLGMGKVITSVPYLLTITKYGGAAFLVFYGLKSLYSAWSAKNSIEVDQSNDRNNLHAVIINILIVSFLNPHVYLDTIILLGSISTHFRAEELLPFTTGAISASFFWFFCLSYGAGYLAPLFRRPLTWRILDVFIGLFMLGIASSLI